MRVIVKAARPELAKGRHAQHKTQESGTSVEGIVNSHFFVHVKLTTGK